MDPCFSPAAVVLLSYLVSDLEQIEAIDAIEAIEAICICHFEVQSVQLSIGLKDFSAFFLVFSKIPLIRDYINKKGKEKLSRGSLSEKENQQGRSLKKRKM